MFVHFCFQFVLCYQVKVHIFIIGSHHSPSIQINNFTLPSLGYKWYFVTKIVLTYYEKKFISWSRKVFEVQDWRQRIFKNFEITRTIYSNSERSEQFLVTECFFNLFLEVSQTWKIRTIKIKIGKNYWDWETCRKS